MMYADYSYYTDNFGGSLIPETDWNRTAGIASSWMDSATFGRLTITGPQTAFTVMQVKDFQ